MEIRLDDLTGPEIAAFLDEHIEEMKSVSPPESIHALDLEELRSPAVTVWTVWERAELIGCGAIMELNPAHAEIKSMRTHAALRRKRVASTLLAHMLGEARRRGYQRVSLETGSMAHFEPARRFYLKHGFEYCEPFSTYDEDPNSVFMTMEL